MGCHVLLVDDDSDTNFINAYWIKKENLASTIGIVLNGEEALEYFHKNPPPDYILLDINMPRMNGWEFLEEYKKLPSELKSQTTIIIVTVSENPDDILKAKKEGVLYATKPLTPAILKTLIAKK